MLKGVCSRKRDFHERGIYVPRKRTWWGIRPTRFLRRQERIFKHQLIALFMRRYMKGDDRIWISNSR